MTYRIPLTNFMVEQVCTLNTRIAAADSMTHDVIRDLLGVKMDITSYAVSISHYMSSSKELKKGSFLNAWDVSGVD